MGMIKIPKKSEIFFEKNYKQIFQTGALAEGEWNKKIKEWAVNYTGSKYSEVFNSNGSGIFSILSVLREYRGKTDYFIQSNTMYGVKTMGAASGLKYTGSVTCELDTLMPSAKSVREFLVNLPNPTSTVFLLTHIGGWVNPDIKKIVELCNEFGVVVVEDCAHSLGATLNGEHTGQFGIAGVYSLYATKAIPVGEGGIMVSNDDELSDLVSRFIVYDRFQQEMSVGINLRMSEINALLAYGVLIETDDIIKSKQDIARRYMDACDSKNIDYINPFSNGQNSNLYKFILLNKTNKEELFAHISLKTSPVYEYMLGEDPQNISKRHICLPIWYGLEEEMIQDTVLQILG
jgi:perosamine synthetase